jgi:hypothetical protein
MKYNAKSLPQKVRSKVARRKRNRYHNDAVLFPDDNLTVDRKRRASLKKNNSVPKVIPASRAVH